VEQLTLVGENRQGQFSRDGKEIIFQSARRPEQLNAQIYILHLDGMKEKRITFNDGEDSWPQFSPDGKRIVYASTTDELKEHPDSPAPSPAPSTTPASTLYEYWGGKLPDEEIYESDADGSHITRLTQSVGFDGEPDFSPDGFRILFTTTRAGQPQIFVMNNSGAGQRKWKTGDGDGFQGVYSPDGKWVAWVGDVADGKGTQIFVSSRYGGQVRRLTREPSVHLTPSWSPDDRVILFSGDVATPSQSKIYAVDVDGSCVRQLTSGKGNDRDPRFSPDGKMILFASDRSGSNQLYLENFIDSGPCLKAPTAASTSKL